MTDSETATIAGEPFGAVGAEPGVCRCGAGPHLDLDDRCAAGHPLPGVPGPALVAGQHSRAFWAAQATARREMTMAILGDAGHSEIDAPRALVLVAEGIAQAALLQASAFARLVESGGPFTSAGRTRQAFAVWQAASDRLERHLRLIGLKRVPRPVDPLQAVRVAVAAANQGETCSR